MYNRKPKLDKEIEKFLATLKDNKTDNEKRKNILFYYDRVTINCGAYGCIMEIMQGGKRKTSVAKQNTNDMYFYYNGKRIKAECKTSGGRIGSLLDGSNKSKFVVYSLDVCNANTSGKNRHIDPVIMPVDMFINLLVECNAIKAINKNGIFDEWGIQCSSKELYLRLAEYPIMFTPESHYTDDDFEGIEI